MGHINLHLVKECSFIYVEKINIDSRGTYIINILFQETKKYFNCFCKFSVRK